MAPGFFSSLSALALGLGGGSWTVNLVKEAYSQACEVCKPCPDLQCTPCSTGTQPVSDGVHVSLAHGALAAVVAVNLLLWAFWAGQSRGVSTARRAVSSHQRRTETYECDDGPEYLRAARLRAGSLR